MEFAYRYPLLCSFAFAFLFMGAQQLFFYWAIPDSGDYVSLLKNWIESMKHGRAILPFGKYRGVRIRLIPDDYLSWLTTSDVVKDAKWKWLKDSLMAELRFRGMRDDLASTSEPEPVKQPLPLVTIGSTRRNIVLEEE